MTEPNITTTPRTCQQCGADFKGRPWRAKSGEKRLPRFCSVVCSQESRRQSFGHGMKRCSRCHKIKSVEHFDKHRIAHDGYKSECKPCRRVYNHSKYQLVKDTPKQKQANLRNALGRYSITVEEYNALVQKQGGVCAICEKPQAKGKRLHVDHCHKMNTVRGLLCIHCNRALGSLGDNLTGLMRAVHYLQRSN